ncbi:MAG: HD domain-containing protein [Anaerolineae bacterium]|nr:HD domain-containing protein [Anaerolineae bacterium]
MSRLTVAELRPNTQLNKAPFLLASLDPATDRNGSPYLKMTLRDKTGDIEARYWRVPDGVAERIKTGFGVLVSGQVTEYKGLIQIGVTDIQPGELDNPEDFLPIARRPREEMLDELQKLISSIKNPHLKALLKEVLSEGDFQRQFLVAAAAKTYHHACVGGLLEHSLDVVKLMLTEVRRYPEIDRDLGATVALLHDVGKVESYAFGGDFDMTDAGKLLGHIYMGAARIERAIDRIEGFPPELKLRVLHAILAHHGDLDKGSPVTPRTPEAIALHYADNLDGSLRGWFDYVKTQGSTAAWTLRSPMHGDELFVGSDPTLKLRENPQ